MARRRRRAAEEEEAATDPTVVLFLALMIILLSFFIMLNSMAKQDDARTRKALNSLFGTFGVVPHGVHYMGSMDGASDLPDFGEFDSIRALQILMDELEGSEDLPGDVHVELRGDDFRVVLSGDLVFGEGEVALSGACAPLLDRLAKRLLLVEKRVRVEGHAAGAKEELEQLPDGTLWEVSLRRAVAAARAIEARGIPSARLMAAGYGDTRPLRANDSEAGRAANRRVEIIVIDGAEDSHLWREPQTGRIQGISVFRLIGEHTMQGSIAKKLKEGEKAARP